MRLKATDMICEFSQAVGMVDVVPDEDVVLVVVAKKLTVPRAVDLDHGERMAPG